MLPGRVRPGGPCGGCDHPSVVEYGNGIANGPAGQVGGAGGGHPLSVGGDPFANVTRFVNDGVAWLGSLPPAELVVLVVAVLVGLFLVRRLLF
jgi:hypothetical protein